MSLLEVDEVLRLNKVPLTRVEADVLNSWRNNAIRDLGIGIGTGSIVSWIVSRRLSNFFRVNLSAVAGVSYGLWRCSKSLGSSVEQCLSLHGTRLQREIAGIILKKYPHEKQLVSKYFICENVYDDASPDKLTQRWRLRNFSGENFDHFQRTEDESYEDASTHLDGNTMKKANVSEDAFVSRRKTQKSDLDQKMSTDDDATLVPFDFIFGPSGNVDEIRHQSPEPSRTLPRKHGRSHRRSQRRHPMHHKETSEAST